MGGQEYYDEQAKKATEVLLPTEPSTEVVTTVTEEAGEVPEVKPEETKEESK